MASWMVHLRITNILLERVDNLDETAFVLGNLSPDSDVPNEDQSVFNPPGDVTLFKIDLKDKAIIDIDIFISKYFPEEMRQTYTKKEYSFFLAYYTYLLRDIEWTCMIRQDGLNEENPRKENMSLTKFIYKNKED